MKSSWVVVVIARTVVAAVCLEDGMKLRSLGIKSLAGILQE